MRLEKEAVHVGHLHFIVVEEQQLAAAAAGVRGVGEERKVKGASASIPQALYGASQRSMGTRHGTDNAQPIYPVSTAP